MLWAIVSGGRNPESDSLSALKVYNELTRRRSYLSSSLTPPLTYVVRPRSAHCETEILTDL